MKVKVCVILCIQTTVRNLILRWAVVKGSFRFSAMVVVVELLKLAACSLYLLATEKRIRLKRRRLFLLCVPAAIYNVQQTLEMVALSRLDAAVYTCLVQLKIVTTAACSYLVLNKTLTRMQLISLFLLTTGTMLAQSPARIERVTLEGLLATLGVSLLSGTAAVYSEKILKDKEDLAHAQVQLALTALVVQFCWILVFERNYESLFDNFEKTAAFAAANSSIGGLVVASVLKYADAVLKGYATAASVVLTAIASSILFRTVLTLDYALGAANIIVAIVLYTSPPDSLGKSPCLDVIRRKDSSSSSSRSATEEEEESQSSPPPQPQQQEEQAKLLLRASAS